MTILTVLTTRDTSPYFRRRGRSLGMMVFAMISEPLAVGWMPSCWMVPGTLMRSL